MVCERVIIQLSKNIFVVTNTLDATNITHIFLGIDHVDIDKVKLKGDDHMNNTNVNIKQTNQV